jgi:hypothetical protein
MEIFKYQAYLNGYPLVIYAKSIKDAEIPWRRAHHYTKSSQDFQRDLEQAQFESFDNTAFLLCGPHVSLKDLETYSISSGDIQNDPSKETLNELSSVLTEDTAPSQESLSIADSLFDSDLSPEVTISEDLVNLFD